MPTGLSHLVTSIWPAASEASTRLWPGVLRKALPWLDQACARVTVEVPALEGALERLDPTLSLSRVRARVVEVRDETHDVKTYVLRPNARFGSFRPGSYVTLRVDADGQRVERAYSLSSAPSTDGLIALTVKRVPGGLVSNWLADVVRPGHVLELGTPQGQFLLPHDLPPKLLMIAAGSGITPVMSMLRALVASRAATEVTLMYFARSPRDVIFARELEQLERTVANVRVWLCVEDADLSWTGARGRFQESLLTTVAPDFRSSETYLCGPSPFMQAVMQALEVAGADLRKLHYERFSADFDASQFLAHSQLVRFVRSGRESLSLEPRTILVEAEALGLPVSSGCRAGTCGTCRCLKKKGVVVDIVTGRASHDGAEWIRPCVSVARGAVEVEL